jgi:hypothetical protein
LRRGSIVRKTPINESVYEEGQRGNAEKTLLIIITK